MSHQERRIMINGWGFSPFAVFVVGSGSSVQARRFRLKVDKHRDGLERGYAFGTASGGTTGSTSALSNG